VVRLVAEEVVRQRRGAGVGGLRRQVAFALVGCDERDAEVFGLAWAYQSLTLAEAQGLFQPGSVDLTGRREQSSVCVRD
jgi:hypothetical protein